MKTVVTLTMNPSIDLFAETEHMVDDGKSRCRVSSREVGGGGINVARNLQRMGVDVLAVFPAGGSNGESFKQILADEQLPFQTVEISGETRQNMAVTDNSSGKMFHFVFPGPELREQEWHDCLDLLNRIEPVPAYLILSGSLPAGVPTDFFGQVATTVRERGTRVILDTSGKALAEAMKSGVYLAKLNRSEFADSGYSGSGEYPDMLAAMGKMVDSGLAEVLIVTLDYDGALLASRDGDRLHVRPPRTKVVSHVGAGDSFVSVLTARLLGNSPVVDAFRYGVAAAAAKVQIPGNQLNDLELVEKIYRKIADQ